VVKPLKMDLTESSETSANINQTPGNHPKVDMLNTETRRKSKIKNILQIFRTIMYTFFVKKSFEMNVPGDGYYKPKHVARFV
jgi:hypothetical protein